MLTITCITTPLSLAFAPIERNLRHFDLAVDFLFMADICRNFNTATVSADDCLIVDQWTLAVAYARSWFVPDLISSVSKRFLFFSVLSRTSRRWVHFTQVAAQPSPRRCSPRQHILRRDHRFRTRFYSAAHQRTSTRARRASRCCGCYGSVRRDAPRIISDSYRGGGGDSWRGNRDTQPRTIESPVAVNRQLPGTVEHGKQ